MGERKEREVLGFDEWMGCCEEEVENEEWEVFVCGDDQFYIVMGEVLVQQQLPPIIPIIYINHILVVIIF